MSPAGTGVINVDIHDKLSKTQLSISTLFYEAETYTIKGVKEEHHQVIVAPPKIYGWMMREPI